jgi:hypothetical protein
MEIRLYRSRLAAAGAIALVLPATALAVKPEPGQFNGTIAIPRFVGTPNELKTQYLQFAVSGNGRRIAAFDIPSCTDSEGRFIYTRKVIRPRVSKTGRIKGSIVHEQGGGGQTIRRWSVSVSGRFVAAKRARGRVRVFITIFRVGAGRTRSKIGECRASGRWKAKRCVGVCRPQFTAAPARARTGRSRG